MIKVPNKELVLMQVSNFIHLLIDLHGETTYQTVVSLQIKSPCSVAEPLPRFS